MGNLKCCVLFVYKNRPSNPKSTSRRILNCSKQSIVLLFFFRSYTSILLHFFFSFFFLLYYFYNCYLVNIKCVCNYQKLGVLPMLCNTVTMLFFMQLSDTYITGP